jgi:hypothetical protein
MRDRIVARVLIDGTRRDIYQQPDGRQYMLDENGERVYGAWDMQRDAMLWPDVIVQNGGWPALVVNVLFYVLGLAGIMVMLAIILLVWAWLFGPTTIGNPAPPPPPGSPWSAWAIGAAVVFAIFVVLVFMLMRRRGR